MEEKKYARRLCVFQEGYLSVQVFKNVRENKSVYYDTVIYRKVSTAKGSEWRRGANLKPSDLALLIKLLGNADDYLRSTLRE